MSQFSQKRLKMMVSTALLALGMSAVTANAGINNPGLKTPLTQSTFQTAALSSLSHTYEAPVLDWRNPIHSITFDVPDTDWTTGVKLTLSVDPVRRVAPDAPLYVQLNTDTPVKLNTRGAGFDARVELDPAKIRSRGNVLRVFYAAPNGAECLLPEHGSWVVNLDASKLTMRRNAKSRNLRVRDVEAFLSSPLTAPKSVSIVAKGSGATALQSLVAQGIGLRMDTLPKFTTATRDGDIRIIAGRRDQILPYVKSEAIINTHGPRLILDEGRPLTLVLTGDTDSEVLDLARQFASYTLPNTSRSITSTGEIVMQSELSSDDESIAQSIKLSELGDTAFEPNWNPQDRVLAFDVADPHASRGEILLRLSTPKSVVKQDGALTLNLNGHTLGQTAFDKTRKSVAFQIPSGILKGQDNVLRMNADLALETHNSCFTQAYTDNGIYLGQGSKLVLSQASKTPLTDLSHLTATGAPFSDASGQETLIVLPSNNRDFNIALGLLSQLAKTSGRSWDKASFTRNIADVAALADNKNVLMIVPSKNLPRNVTTQSPKSFQSAMRGMSFQGDNLLQAELDRYAGINAQDIYRSVAQKTAARNNIRKGGAAAIYRSPYDADKLIGVITNVPGQTFSSAIASIKQVDHWNALQGSVARWSDDSVVMAELSSDLPGFVRSKGDDSTLPSLALPQLNLPSFEAVKFKFAEFNWPQLADLQTPEFDIEKLKFWDRGTISRNVATSESGSFLDVALRESPAQTTSTTILTAEDLNLRGLSPVSVQQRPGVLEGTKNKLKDITSTRWSRFDLDQTKFNLPKIDLGKSVTTLQRELQPLRKSWKAKLRGLSVPGKSTAKWGLNQMSAAALLLILMFSLLVIFLGFASPSNRSGSHH
jgi:hypothetical protein